jgi:uncharacterized protein (TIGR01777 family)
MKVAIAGSTGMVGTALVAYLKSKGHYVTALKRTVGGPNAFQSVSPDYLEDFDAVINLAGENIAAKRWTEAQKKLIIDSRVSTTTCLAKALAQTKSAKVFLNASAVGIYGNRGSETINEDSASGSGFLASTCKQWEEAAEQAMRPGLRLVRMRIGVVISKNGGALSKMLLPFQLGGGGILGSGQQYMSWISVHDIVRAIEFSMTNEKIAGAVNLTAPNPVTNAEFTRIMGKVLHRPTILPAPGFGLKLILGDMAQEMLLEGNKVIPDKLIANGFKFEYQNLEAALLKEIRPAALEKVGAAE